MREWTTACHASCTDPRYPSDLPPYPANTFSTFGQNSGVPERVTVRERCDGFMLSCRCVKHAQGTAYLDSSSEPTRFPTAPLRFMSKQVCKHYRCIETSRIAFECSQHCTGVFEYLHGPLRTGLASTHACNSQVCIFELCTHGLRLLSTNMHVLTCMAYASSCICTPVRVSNCIPGLDISCPRVENIRLSSVYVSVDICITGMTGD